MSKIIQLISSIKERSFLRDLTQCNYRKHYIIYTLEELKREDETIQDYIADFVIYLLESRNMSLFIQLSGPKGENREFYSRIFVQLWYDLGYIDSTTIIKINPKELLGKYLGHMEYNLRNFLQKNRKSAILIDKSWWKHRHLFEELIRYLYCHHNEVGIIIVGTPD